MRTSLGENAAVWVRRVNSLSPVVGGVIVSLEIWRERGTLEDMPQWVMILSCNVMRFKMGVDVF
jgi:hypothetical protein